MTPNSMTVIGYSSAIVNAAKSQLELFYSSDNATLESKWHCFTMAPAYLKNHQSDCPDFKYSDNSEVDLSPFYNLDRYRVYFTEDIVEQMQDAVNDPEAYGLDKTLTQEDIDFVKIQILAMNLDSFTYDW